MKKKVLALVLSVVMCFAVTACGDKETSASNEPKSEAASEEVSARRRSLYRKFPAKQRSLRKSLPVKKRFLQRKQIRKKQQEMLT